MREILKYFKELTEEQIRQFTMLDELYREWNAKINVISRKDIDNLYEHHVLHSISIAMLLHFKPNTKILDFGTGGGFPGIPLAILFPECRFTLIDGTGKKIRVANEISNALNLQNVEAKQIRGEEERGKYHFIVSRAVMPLTDMSKILQKNIDKKQMNVLPNGIICLKGGNLDDEIGPYRHIAEVTPISNWFEEEWFNEKNIVYLPL